jgi:hypothetical protein
MHGPAEVNSGWPRMAEFLGFSGPIHGRRARPLRVSWRRERNPGRTLSGAFSMRYEVHGLRWMLPGESKGDSCNGFGLARRLTFAHDTALVLDDADRRLFHRDVEVDSDIVLHGCPP